jgi:starch synthase
MATSEVTPFAKTGGLADVCGALPIELTRLGHPTAVIMPAFRQAKRCGEPIEDLDVTFDIPIGAKIVSGRLLRSRLPGSEVPVYLVQQDSYFDRAELYRENGADYKDNCERFVFFSRAVLEAVRLLNLDINLIHCNDWQTGLVPAYLNIEYSNAVGYEQLGTVLTIHNMAYQGQFWHWDMLLTGLDWKYFNWHQMEFYGHLNLLKTGLVFADSITTVSPRYAEEIQQAPLGSGLETVLQKRREQLYGIINGVDYRVWDPAIDPHLPARYSVDNWAPGKAACKAALQTEMGLPTEPGVPLIGIVGRLVDQKGFDLIARIMEQWARHTDAQWIVLGTGEPGYHQLLRRLAQEYPHRIACRLEFSDPLAHRIEAGADLFLMPSRYEPCGLNQLYSLKYGAVPVVHATGGLADTIVDAGPEQMTARTATGFSFLHYDAAALEEALTRACDVYCHDRDAWSQIVETGMRQDWSWNASAKRYVEVYEETIARLSQTVCA